MGPAATLDEFFAGYPESRRIFDALRTIVDAIGAHDCRVSRSQVACLAHHLELSVETDLDAEVREWLLEAWRAAG